MRQAFANSFVFRPSMQNKHLKEKFNHGKQHGLHNYLQYTGLIISLLNSIQRVEKVLNIWRGILEMIGVEGQDFSKISKAIFVNF